MSLLRQGSERLPKPDVARVLTDAWMPTGNDLDGRQVQICVEYFDVTLPPSQNPLRDEGNKVITGQQLEQHMKAWDRNRYPTLMANRRQCFVCRTPQTASSGVDEQMIKLAELSE